MAARPKLLYFVSVDWYFVSHRLALALAAKEAGYDVTVVTQVLKDGATIRDAGLKLAPITLGRASLQPWHELNRWPSSSATTGASPPISCTTSQ